MSTEHQTKSICLVEQKKLADIDDFKEKVCHSSLREHSFKDFWEGALGMDPIDLNSLTANQFQAVGELASMNIWDGEIAPGKLSDCGRGKYCHGLQPIGRGEYFKVVIWYNLNDDKEKYRYYFFGLTEDFRFFDASYKDAQDEPAAAYELRELFGIGSWRERMFGNRPSTSPPECAHCRILRLDPDSVITTQECFCDKFKKKHCNGWLDSYDLPIHELWRRVWKLPPIDFNELNYAQVGSISRFLGYSDYSKMKPGMKRGKNYYAIVDHNFHEYGEGDIGGYAQGLTSDYYFFEDDNYVDYPGAAKEMIELFPEAFKSRSTMDDELVMRALGGLWAAEVEVSEHTFEDGTTVEKHTIKSTRDSRAHDAIWRLSELYNDETGMRELHCLERERWPFRFYGLDETSYLRMGLEKKMVQWQREAVGKAAAEFIRAFDSSSYKDAYNVLTDEQKAIVDGLRERGTEWLEIWRVAKEIHDLVWEKGQETIKFSNGKNWTTRINYGMKDVNVDLERIAEHLREKKWIRDELYYDSVLVGTATFGGKEWQKVLVVERYEK
jgi:hypothetical protein